MYIILRVVITTLAGRNEINNSKSKILSGRSKNFSLVVIKTTGRRRVKAITFIIINYFYYFYDYYF